MEHIPKSMFKSQHPFQGLFLFVYSSTLYEFMHVIVPDDKPPKIFNFTTNTAVNASQNVKLFCGTEGEPPFADVQWFKNGVSVGRCKGELQQNKTCVLDQHHRKYSISWRGSGAELMIKNVFHPFDTGDFTCVAVNTIGMDNKTVHLDIYGKCG